jgi:GT2 family glycosyltransferase
MPLTPSFPVSIVKAIVTQVQNLNIVNGTIRHTHRLEYHTEQQLLEIRRVLESMGFDLDRFQEPPAYLKTGTPSPSIEYADIWVERDVTVVIKSFRRFSCLWRLVRSIRKRYPAIKIIVVDDSLQRGQQPTDAEIIIREMPDVEWVRLPFDSGISAGRNAGVARVKTKFTVICDDDFVFIEETNLSTLLQACNHKAVDLVGGLVAMDGEVPENWTGELDLVEKLGCWHITHHEDRNVYTRLNGVKCMKTGVTLNFFMARTEVLKKHPWDERFTIGGEHLDTFMRWSHLGVKIHYTPEVVIGHHQIYLFDYNTFRRRHRWSWIVEKYAVSGVQCRKRHRYVEVECQPTKEVVQNLAQQDRPNIVILGTGRCGSSIAVSMLERLGWTCPSASQNEYMEHPEILRLSEQAQGVHMLDNVAASMAVDGLVAPWVIKQPRFSETWPLWRPFFDEENTLLLHITRDAEAVASSIFYAGWSEKVDVNHVKHLHALNMGHFNAWRGPKLQLGFEQIKSAVRLFDTNRG